MDDSDNRFQSLSGLSLGLNPEGGMSPQQACYLFQSLSGLSLGLNQNVVRHVRGKRDVSIPFRAVTGFELNVHAVHAPFDAVSIPFRAVTGFERARSVVISHSNFWFQSLSGLSLGLNPTPTPAPVAQQHMFQSLSGLSLGLNFS